MTSPASGSDVAVAASRAGDEADRGTADAPPGAPRAVDDGPAAPARPAGPAGPDAPDGTPQDAPDGAPSDVDDARSADDPTPGTAMDDGDPGATANHAGPGAAAEDAEATDANAVADGSAGLGRAGRPRHAPTTRRLATGCGALDALLDGGLEQDAVTLVFGEGGSGKTNLAIQCARQTAEAGGRIAFVDTEGVSADRLRQVFGDGPELERLLFFTPFDFKEQEQMVRRSTLVKGLGLVVVDSINMHYRLHIDGGDDAEREAARSLYKQLHHLTGFARRHNVPVLVTGQVFGTEDATQPFARRTMEHLVKAAVRFEKRPDGTRRATVVKHRSIPDGRQALFRIGAHGLEDMATG